MLFRKEFMTKDSNKMYYTRGEWGLVPCKGSSSANVYGVRLFSVVSCVIVSFEVFKVELRPYSNTIDFSCSVKRLRRS